MNVGCERGAWKEVTDDVQRWSQSVSSTTPRGARRYRVRVFLFFFLPRLILSIVFSSVGYFGSGGDAEVYHVLGLYGRDLWLDPGHASLEGLLADWWNDDEPLRAKYTASVEAIEPDAPWFFGNTVFPIIAAHAATYMLWPQPFAFVLLTSLLSTFAHVRLIAALSLAGASVRWLALNPVSVYFAATHYKESICESLVLMLMASLEARRRRVLKGAVLSACVAVFRTSYVPVIPLLWLGRSLAKIDARLIVGVLLVAFVGLPLPRWQALGESRGALYSMVHWSDLTERLLGPIVGLAMPVPFVEPLDGTFNVFLSVYGVFYWLILLPVLAHVIVGGRANRFVTSSISISLCISYYVVGGMSSKARFFAPFVPLLVIGFVQTRCDVLEWVLRLGGARSRATVRATGS